MKWIRAALGVMVIGGFVYGVHLWKSGQAPEVVKTLVPIDTELVQGTEVPLLLLTPLDSGQSKVGDPVKLVVAETVKDGNGRTLVREGETVSGKVVRARQASAGAAIINQPARLEIEFEPVKGADGKPVKLDGPYEFTQANTRLDAKPDAATALQDPKARAFARDSVARMLKGESLSEEEKKAADAQLKELADRYGLESARKLSKGDKPGATTGAFEALQKGDLSGLAPTEALLAAKALGEVVSFAGGIDDAVKGFFKGSDIRARTGVKVVARVAEARTLRLPG
jgi:hypothetical protein